MCNSSHLQTPARAFTLIELLVVIGIIAVLASILLPVIGTAHAQSDTMKCSANLRQLGTGINGYVSDHDGRLPGPLQPLIFPAYSDEASQQTSLVKLITPYISVNDQVKPGTQIKSETVTTCPAFVRVVKSSKLPCYVLNFADQIPDVGVPWGDMNGSGQPVLTAVLTAWRDSTTGHGSNYTPSPNGEKDLTRTWAIKDADLKAFTNMAGVSGTGGLPDKPVHGDFRNALFYDWHVGKIDLDDNPYAPK